jgi:hypothetical protein
VLVGLNRVVAHAGRELHVQVEDLGVEQAALEARVYENGGVVWRKRVSYQDVLARNLPKLEQEEELLALMEKTLHTVQAAIAKGKLA